MTLSYYYEYFTCMLIELLYSKKKENEPALKVRVDVAFSSMSSLTSLPTTPKTYIQKLRLIDALARRSYAGNRRFEFTNPLHFSSVPRCMPLTTDIILTWGHSCGEIKFSVLEGSLSRPGEPVPPTASMLTVKAHYGMVTCAAFDDAYLVTGSTDCTAKVWKFDIKAKVYVTELIQKVPPFYIRNTLFVG